LDPPSVRSATGRSPSAFCARLAAIWCGRLAQGMACFEAVRSFSPVGQDCSGQLALMEGDRLRVLEKDASGWWAGHKEGENVTGWFPGDAVRIVNLHTTAQDDMQAPATAGHSQPKGAHSWTPVRTDVLTGGSLTREGASMHRRPSQSKRDVVRAYQQPRSTQMGRRPSATPFSESRRAARASPENRPCASPVHTRDGKENVSAPSNRTRSPISTSKGRQPACSPSRPNSSRMAASPLTTQDGRAVSTPFGNADARGRRRFTSSTASTQNRLRLKASGHSAQLMQESPSTALRELRRSTCSYAPTVAMHVPKQRGSYGSPRLGAHTQAQQRSPDSFTHSMEAEKVTAEAYAAQQAQLQQLQEELRRSREEWTQLAGQQQHLEEELRQLQAQRCSDNDRHHQQQMELMSQREQQLKSEIRHLTEERNMASELRRVGRLEQDVNQLRDALSSKEARLTALEGQLSGTSNAEAEMEASVGGQLGASTDAEREGAAADSSEESSRVRSLIAAYEQRSLTRNSSQDVLLREPRPSYTPREPRPSQAMLSRGSSRDALRSQNSSWLEARSPSPVMS